MLNISLTKLFHKPQHSCMLMAPELYRGLANDTGKH